MKHNQTKGKKRRGQRRVKNIDDIPKKTLKKRSPGVPLILNQVNFFLLKIFSKKLDNSSIAGTTEAKLIKYPSHLSPKF
jgi:hypothetical protein